MEYFPPDSWRLWSLKTSPHMTETTQKAVFDHMVIRRTRRNRETQSKPRTAPPDTEVDTIPWDERSLINQAKPQPYLEAASSIDSYSLKYHKAFWITLWTELLFFLTYAVNISGFISVSGKAGPIYFSITYTFLIYICAVVAIVESVYRTRKHDREGTY